MRYIFARFLLIITLAVYTITANCMLPVKGVDDLALFTAMHQRLAHVVILSQVESFVEKCKKLENSTDILRNLSSAETRLRDIDDKDPSRASVIADKKLFEETKKEFKRLFSRDERFIEIFDSDFDFEHDFDRAIDFYGEHFLRKSIDDILSGNYGSMFSTLPKAYNSPIFNTFVCAFSFIHEDGNISDIFLDDPILSTMYAVPEDVRPYNDTFVFISGESRKVLAPMAIQVQASSLGGSIPLEIFGRRIEGLESAFRHSEQKAFVMLYGPRVVEHLRSKLSNLSPIREIVFHGCTLRDMCPNCCATLTSHEMLAYTSELGHRVNQESFLVYLQNSFRSEETIPMVTSIVSSLIRYYSADDEPISWNLHTHTSLVDKTAVTEAGITPRFVNQFRLSERFFLETFFNAFSKQAPKNGLGANYCAEILRAISQRLSHI